MIFHLGTLMPSAREGPPLRRHPLGRWGRSFHLSPPNLDATLEMKEQALAKISPLHGKAGHFRPTDQLLAFLNSL